MEQIHILLNTNLTSIWPSRCLPSSACELHCPNHIKALVPKIKMDSVLLLRREILSTLFITERIYHSLVLVTWNEISWGSRPIEKDKKKKTLNNKSEGRRLKDDLVKELEDKNNSHRVEKTPHNTKQIFCLENVPEIHTRSDNGRAKSRPIAYMKHQTCMSFGTTVTWGLKA